MERERNSKIKFLSLKESYKIWDVNVNDIIISNIFKTKTNSKYLIGIKLDKAIRPLVLIIPIKLFKVKEEDQGKSKKLISFCIDDKKLLAKYKTIWNKIENLKTYRIQCCKSLWWEIYKKQNKNIWR